KYRGVVGRQMELAPADVDPHVVVRGHQVGVAREPKPGGIEQGRQPLVRDRDIDVLEVDGIAEVLGGAIEGLLHGDCSGRVLTGHYSRCLRAASKPGGRCCATMISATSSRGRSGPIAEQAIGTEA